MLGEKLPALHPKQNHYAVKSVVFPFLKIMGADIKLGPEMRSTGETMGIGKTFEMAYYKALLAAGIRLEDGKKRSAFISLQDEDKPRAAEIAALLRKQNFTIYGTFGTVGSIPEAIAIPKIGIEHPDVIELIESGTITLVINTPTQGPLDHGRVQDEEDEHPERHTVHNEHQHGLRAAKGDGRGREERAGSAARGRVREIGFFAISYYNKL